MARAILICQPGFFAAATLRGWLEAGNEVAEIWTAPTRPLREVQKTITRFAPGWSLYAVAKRHAIPHFVNPPLRHWLEAGARIAALKADTLITCMTMQIVPDPLIARFGGRAVNLHPALLPNFRGPSPFLGVLLDRRENNSAGVTLHVLTSGIDEGPIIAARPIPFDGVGRSYQAWLVEHAQACRELARSELQAYLAGDRQAVPQLGGSYRRVREEARIGSHLTLGQARHALDAAGGSRRIMVQAADRKRRLAVRGIDVVLGPPTGDPPVASGRRLTLDLADARVRLRLWGPVAQALDRLTLLRAIRRVERRAAQE